MAVKDPNQNYRNCINTCSDEKPKALAPKADFPIYTEKTAL